MEIHGPTRFAPRKSSDLDRFLSAYPQASQSSESFGDTADDDELNEDDIFTTEISESADHHRHSKQHQSHLTSTDNGSNKGKKTNLSEKFGILAALPESRTHCYHKTSSISSSRAIPGIPKSPTQQERSSLGKLQHQSAPVNVPVLAKAMKNGRQFDEVDDDDGTDDEIVMPPHEIVARANTPVVSCSLLEGAGRTLKGRDLRQVRNAVFRQTGFLD